MSMQRFVAVGAFIGLAIGLGGCRFAGEQRFSDSRIEETAVTEVRIEGDGGSVVLDRVGTTTQIDRTVTYDEENEPAVRYDRVENGVLILNTTCPATNCSIDYRVHVPKAVKVTGRLSSGRIDIKDVTTATVATDSGRISLAGVAGDVNATSYSGRIDVSDVRGRLNVMTESGSIHVAGVTDVVTLLSESGSINASGLAGSQTSAKATSGSISLTTVVAQNISATTDSGRITITVPPGEPYRLHQSTESGARQANIQVSDNAKFLIEVSTEGGRITINESRTAPSSRPASRAPSTPANPSTPAASAS